MPRQKLGAAMVEYFLKRWEAESSGHDMQMLLRSTATHRSAAKRMHEIFLNQLVPFVRQYCVTERAECAALVAMQMLGFGYVRYVLKYPEAINLPKPVILKRIGATIQAYLETR